MLHMTEEKFLAAPADALDHLQSSRETLSVSSRKGGYVILDSAEWRNICETIHLNSIEGLAESIIEASQEPLEESIPLEELDW